MIQTYKILHGLYDGDVPRFALSTYTSTRGNKFKLYKSSCKKNVRKYYFTNRVVDPWNSLADYVVDAPNVNVFKNRLDKHWECQELLYDFKASIVF